MKQIFLGTHYICRQRRAGRSTLELKVSMRGAIRHGKFLSKRLERHSQFGTVVEKLAMQNGE
jgi:hypothetical protein